MTNISGQYDTPDHSSRYNNIPSPDFGPDPFEGLGEADISRIEEDALSSAEFVLNSSSPGSNIDSEAIRFKEWYDALPSTAVNGKVLPKDWTAPYQPSAKDYVPSSKSSPFGSSPSETEIPADNIASKESKKRAADDQEPETSRHGSKRQRTIDGRSNFQINPGFLLEEPIMDLPNFSRFEELKTPQIVSPTEALIDFTSGVPSNIIGREFMESRIGEYADRKSHVRTALVGNFMAITQATMYSNNVYESQDDCATAYVELLKNVGEALQKYNVAEKSSLVGRRFENEFGSGVSDDIAGLSYMIDLSKANRAVIAYYKNVDRQKSPIHPFPSMQSINDQGHPPDYYAKNGTLKLDRISSMLRTNLQLIEDSLVSRKYSRNYFLETISKFETETHNLEKDLIPLNKEAGRHNTKTMMENFRTSIKRAFEDVHVSERENADRYSKYVKSTMLNDRQRERGHGRA